jgi:hypothetical protein
MIYRIPLSALGPAGLDDAAFVVGAELRRSNPNSSHVEPKKWYFDLTITGSSGIIAEEGE